MALYTMTVYTDIAMQLSIEADTEKEAHEEAEIIADKCWSINDENLAEYDGDYQVLNVITTCEDVTESEE